MAHPALKQAIKIVEKDRQPITAQDITDFGVTMELDQELQHFLVSLKESEALETVRGLKGSQTWSNGEDWPPCATHWPPDAV